LDAVEKRAGVDAKLVVEGNINLSSTVEQEMFRVLLEALNNALNHSSATSVCVLLSAEEDRVIGAVEDDGLGFDTASAGESGGMGLRNMRDRITTLGGTIKLTSSPGSGTTVRVLIPNAIDSVARPDLA
jgi:NarL family two-component system sensor histidine kinase LiaS